MQTLQKLSFYLTFVAFFGVLLGFFVQFPHAVMVCLLALSSVLFGVNAAFTEGGVSGGLEDWQVVLAFFVGLFSLVLAIGLITDYVSFGSYFKYIAASLGLFAFVCAAIRLCLPSRPISRPL